MIYCQQELLPFDNNWKETLFRQKINILTNLRKLNTEPSIGASHQVSVHLAKQFQRRRFSEIDQSETRMACGVLVSDWLISKKSSPLKPLCQMNRNVVGSILGRSFIKSADLVSIR
jgi:hypothetical protein